MPLPATLRCTCPCTSTRRKPGSRLRVRRPRALERETHLERPLRGFKAATRGGAGQTCERGSWRDLARSRPGVATDRPTGRLRAGIAHNLVLPGWAKLSRLAPSLPLRLTPLNPSPWISWSTWWGNRSVGNAERCPCGGRQSECGQPGKPARACPQRRAVGSQVVQHGGTWHYRLSLSRIELSSRVGRRPASPDWRMPGRGRRARVLQAQEGATWYAPGRPAKVIPLFPETGPPPRVTRG